MTHDIPKRSPSSPKVLFAGLMLTLAVGWEQVMGYSFYTADQLQSLRFVQLIFRHGDRAPTNTYPNDPYKNNETIWPEGMAQLTSIGKMQQYNLGRYFRDRYDGFIGQKFNSHEVYGVSSDMDRTIMSLECNVAGLFPPVHKWHPKLEWQPIPLRTIPWKEDNYLHSNVRCPKYDALHRTFLQSSEVILQMNMENRDFVKFLSEKSGISATTVKEIIPLQDILHVQWLHNLSLPDWALEALPRLTELQAQANVWSTYTTEMKRLHGGPLLDLLLKKMLAKTGADLLAPIEEGTVLSGGRNSKILMYSAHDSTLARIMNTLGIFHPHNPPYAAALILELHQNEIDKSHFVKIFYRNDSTRDPYQMTIPDCGEDCELHKMVSLYNHLLPRDFSEECKDTSLLRGPSSPWSLSYAIDNPFYMLVILSVILILILILWFLIVKIVQHTGDNGKFLHRHRRPCYERI